MFFLQTNVESGDRRCHLQLPLDPDAGGRSPEAGLHDANGAEAEGSYGGQLLLCGRAAVCQHCPTVVLDLYCAEGCDLV